MALFFFGDLVVRAQTMDTIIFGNSTSENGHGLFTGFDPVVGIVTPQASDPPTGAACDTPAGSFGQTTRRLLPRKPNPDIYGGYMTFTMTVDPIYQNYFTLKILGSDGSDGQRIILNCEGKEIGFRHGGNDEETIDPSGGWFANGFIYRTIDLPINLTHGKTNVTIKLRSSGYVSPYDALIYVPNFQKNMNNPTIPLYCAYTHINGVLDVSGEMQGAGPNLITPRTVENETTVINNWKSSVSSKVNGLLSSASPSASDVQYLAEACGVTWTPACNSALAVTQVISGIDGLVTQYATNSGAATSGWGGNFGPLGDAIRLLYPQLSNSLDTVVSFGGTVGTVTRRAGWSAALRASLDSGRYNRQNIANQAQFNSVGIYMANRGLELIDPANALNELEALRYLYESSGMSSWLGNDQNGGGPVPVKGIAPYGPNWYMVTTKGTSKDGNDFCGGDYGEIGSEYFTMSVIAGDTNLMARALTLIRARAPFRYPASDGSGYRVMYCPDPIGCRNDGPPGHIDYLGPARQDDFLVASQGAAVVGNDVLGYFQQQMNEGQLLPLIASGNINDSGAPYLPDRYYAIKALAQTGVKLPGTPGQPDFAWGDEENMVVAAKHGEDRFFTVFTWHSANAISGLVKVFQLTTNIARLAELKVNDVRFNPAGFVTMRGYQVEDTGFPQDEPVDPHENANDGVCYEQAMRSDFTAPPSGNRDTGRGTGYTLRFGNWLVGVNAHLTTTYTMQLPAGFTTATNLVDGTVLTAPVILSPKTTVVFYLEINSDPNPPPARPLFLSGNGFNSSVALKWNYGSGATNYNVKRATVSDGTYATVGSTTNNFYTDSTAANNTAYYYVVSSVNANGESGNSMEVSTTPRAASSAGLPSPWTDSDIGSPGSVGSSTIVGTNYTVNGCGGDIWNNSDQFHFLYQPLSGNGVFTARLKSETGSSTKAGVMIRNSAGANAINVIMYVQPGSAQFQSRTSTGGGTGSSSVSANAPFWVRLVRAGATLTGFASLDGTNWTQVSSSTIGPGGEGLGYVVDVGLAVCAHNNSQLNTAVFDNVSLVAGDNLPPIPPSNLQATASPGTVALIWNAASLADAYVIERATTNGGPYTTIGSNTYPKYTDAGLLNGVTYYYVVVATNRYGQSVNSGQASATPTYIGTKYSGTIIGSNGSYLNSSNTKDKAFDSNLATYYDAYDGSGDWTGLDYGAGVSYLIGRIRYCPRNGYGSRMVGGIFQGDYDDATFTTNPVTLYTVNTPPPNNVMTEVVIGITNKFRYVRYLGPANGSCNVAEIEFYSSLLPVPPTGLTAVASNQQVLLTWATNSGATDYNLKRSLTSGGAYRTILPNTIGTNYTDTGLINGVAYYYVVTATNGYGESDNSAEVSVTPAGKVTGTIIGTAGSWNNAGNTIAKAFDGDLTTYFDGPDGSGDWVGLDFGSGVSNMITQIKYCPRNTYASRMTGGIYQGANDPNFATPVILFTISGSPTQGMLTSQTINNTNAFRYVRYFGPASGSCNVAELEFDGFSMVWPYTPTGLTVTSGDAQVVLNWSVAANATSYKVKRSTTSGASYTIVTTNSSVTFTNTGLANGTMYYFVVSGLNSSGEGNNSAEVGARPVSMSSPQASVAISGNQIQLNWPADHLGWRVLVQTNSSGVGLGTNWVAVPNSNLTDQYSSPVSLTNGSVFFRLVYP